MPRFVMRTTPWREDFQTSQRRRSAKRSRQNILPAGHMRPQSRSVTTDRTPLARSNSRSALSQSSIGDGTPMVPTISNSTSSDRDQTYHRDMLRQMKATDGFDLDLDDTMNMIIMAFELTSRKTVGCCYFSVRDRRLHILNDVHHGDLDILEELKAIIEPTTILISSNSDESVDSVLDPGRGAAHLEASNGQFHLPYIVEMRPKKSFSFSNALFRLTNLNVIAPDPNCTSIVVPGDIDSLTTGGLTTRVGHDSSSERLHILSTHVDLTSRVSIGCAGAILEYLETQAMQMLGDGRSDIGCINRITFIEMFSMQGFVHVNSDCLTALQIIDMGSNPRAPTQALSSATNIGSLSVHNIFSQFAKTPQGKRLLRQTLLRPLLDVCTIAQRQDTIGALLRTVNCHARDTMCQSLKSIKDLRPVLANLRKGINRVSENKFGIRNGVWSTLRSFAFHTLEIYTCANELQAADEIAICKKILQLFPTEALATVGQDITTTIDFKASVQEKRTVINPGIDRDLDALKILNDGIEDLLCKFSDEVIAEFSHSDGNFYINVVNFPQIGFLIALHRDIITGDFPSPPQNSDTDQWMHVFSAEDITYFKDAKMRGLDQQYGDIAGKICDKETEIIFGLGQRLLEHEEALCLTSDICGELDLLLTFTQAADAFDLCKPHVTSANIIDIRNGRHLIQEQLSNPFVPNDTLLSGPADEWSQQDRDRSIDGQDGARDTSMIIVTGPNYSEKAFVPAEEATIGLTDRIMTRITTRETVSRQQSAFMIDLQQVFSAVKAATSRTLCIIDEFGKGTNCEDGAGIAYAVLRHFLERGPQRPRVLAATHFTEVLDDSLINSSWVSVKHMTVLQEPETDISRQITPLYKLEAGIDTRSFGIECAAANGIPQQIIRRAIDLRQAACQRQTDLRQDEEQRAENIGHAFLNANFKDSLTEYHELMRSILAKNDSGLIAGSVASCSRSFAQGSSEDSVL